MTDETAQSARIPVHVDLAPADGGYDNVEVDPWPHIHLHDAGDGTVSVRLRRWKGQHVYDHYSERELAPWTIEVSPPGRLARIWGDSIERRIDRAIVTLRRRWDQRVADAHDAYVATRRIDR